MWASQRWHFITVYFYERAYFTGNVSGGELSHKMDTGEEIAYEKLARSDQKTTLSLEFTVCMVNPDVFISDIWFCAHF